MNSEIGAFFDIDGTLVPSPSLEWRFIAFLLSRDEVRLRHARAWAVNFLKQLPHGWNAAAESNKNYLAGSPVSLVQDWKDVAKCGSTSFQIPFFPGGIDRIIWHASQQHKIILLTGTLQPLARVAAEAIEQALASRGFCVSVDVIATRIESVNGFWTGRLVGEHMSGFAKADAVHGISKTLGINLAKSYAYGDRWSDLPVLRAVGHPTAVNPGAALERIACQSGWQIRRWRIAMAPAPPARRIPTLGGAR